MYKILISIHHRTVNSLMNDKKTWNYPKPLLIKP